MTVNLPNEKTADVLAHVNGKGTRPTQRNSPMSKFSTAPIFELRLENHGKSTGVAFATLAGDMLPMSEYMRVIVPKQAVRDACAAPSEFIVSDGDVVEHNRRIRANRAKADDRRRQQRRLLDMEERIAAAADTLRIDATADDIARAAAAALTVLNRTEQGADK